MGKGLEIASFADIPSGGTGLGSSSSFIVGLLNALHAWKGEYAVPEQLANEAIKIEREILKEHGGKQDQYIAAYGGLQFMEFNLNGTVTCRPITMSEESMEQLRRHLMLFYIGGERSSSGILKSQVEEADGHIEAYDKMKEIAYEMYKKLSNNKWESTGRFLDENWKLKRTLANGISNTKVDSLYEAAKAAGAEGGKLMGAGGSGFMLLFAKPERHDQIAKALGTVRQEPFNFTYQGSRIAYVGD